MTMSTPPPRSARSDQLRNRQALLKAAREVFAEHGLSAPLDDIAKRAGLGNATIYRHFGDRRGLIAYMVTESLRRHEQAIDDALALGGGWDGFSFYMEWLFAEQLADLGYLSALREIPAGQSDEVDRLRDNNMAGFRELIDRAKREGSLRADAWPEDVFLLLFANEQLRHLSETPQRAASARFLQLAFAALRSSNGAMVVHSSEPEDVLTLRHTLVHDLAGPTRTE